MKNGYYFLQCRNLFSSMRAFGIFIPLSPACIFLFYDLMSADVYAFIYRMDVCNKRKYKENNIEEKKFTFLFWNLFIGSSFFNSEIQKINEEKSHDPQLRFGERKTKISKQKLKCRNAQKFFLYIFQVIFFCMPYVQVFGCLCGTYFIRWTTL